MALRNRRALSSRRSLLGVAPLRIHFGCCTFWTARTLASEYPQGPKEPHGTTSQGRHAKGEREPLAAPRPEAALMDDALPWAASNSLAIRTARRTIGERFLVSGGTVFVSAPIEIARISGLAVTSRRIAAQSEIKPRDGIRVRNGRLCVCPD